MKKSVTRRRRQQKRHEKRLRRHPRFEVGDFVITRNDEVGIIESFYTMTTKNGFGTARRYYKVRLYDETNAIQSVSQSGRGMTKLPSVEEVLGEGYLA